MESATQRGNYSEDAKQLGCRRQGRSPKVESGKPNKHRDQNPMPDGLWK